MIELIKLDQADSMKNFWVHASIYGNRTKEKNMKVMEWLLNSEAKKEFLEKVKKLNEGKDE